MARGERLGHERVLVSNGEAYSPEAFTSLKRFHPSRRFEAEYLKDGWLRVFEIVKFR